MVIKNSKLMPRKVVPKILKYINDDTVIVLIGPRQSGKTSVMKLLITELESIDNHRYRIFYFDLEEIAVLERVEAGVNEFVAYLHSLGMEREITNYVFVDEIQYMSNPTNFIKLIADHHKYIKLIVSGSSTFEIRRKFMDSLAGRKIVFEILPLDFEEFLLFKNEKRLAELINQYSLRNMPNNTDIKEASFRFYIKDMQRYFQEYATFGGYPRVALESDYEKKTTYLLDIYNSYVRKDIKDLMRIDNISAFNKLIKMLALQISNLTNNSELAVSVQLSRITIDRYLFLLENTFIIKLIPPFFSNKRKEIVKMSKLFFLDTGLRNVIINNLEPVDNRPDKGSIVENVVFSNLYKNSQLLESIHFWRTKSGNEVDFVLQQRDVIPIEVKYRPFPKPIVPAGMRSFMKDYTVQRAYILTGDYYGTLDSKPEFIYLPVWLT